MTNDNATPGRSSTKETLALYSSAHRWLALPFVVILIAFAPIYFATFTSEPWAYHMHAMSALAWYGLMITQPYLATHGKLRDHRKWGMLGLLFAGGFIATALAITPTNVYFGIIGGFPPTFPGDFFFGLVFTETLAIIGFAVAAVMAVVKAKEPDEHAAWMLGTVFFGFMPAWLRLSMFPAFAFNIEISTTMALLISAPIFVLVILYVGHKIGKLFHPMTIGSSIVTLLMISTSTVGSFEWFQTLVTDLMIPMVPWPEPG